MDSLPWIFPGTGYLSITKTNEAKIRKQNIQITDFKDICFSKQRNVKKKRVGKFPSF